MNTLRLLAAAACILVIASCLTMILHKELGAVGLDLTEKNVYSLSQGTTNILGALNQPVHLKLYYSRTEALKGPEEIRRWNAYYLYVRDLLREYVARADGKLTLEIVDPRTYSDEAAEAEEHGVRALLLSEEGDQRFFFGLVARNELGKEKAIPFFDRHRRDFVEYEIAKVIADVTRRDKKKLGILSPLPVMGADIPPHMRRMMMMQGRQIPQPWVITRALESKYEVETVAKDVKELPKDLDFLLLIHPKDLSEETLFAIDQFVMKGGRLLVFVDPHCMQDMPQNQMQMMQQQHDSSSQLDTLLNAWGVKMKKGLIAADRTLGQVIPLDPSGRTRGKLNVLLNLNEHCVNHDEVSVAELDELRLLYAGVLDEVKSAGSTVVPLLTTTSEGGTWQPGGPFDLRWPPPVDRINQSLRVSGKQMLACRITGKLRSAFPQGIMVPAEDKDDDSKAGEEEDDAEKDDAEKDEDTDKDKKDEPTMRRITGVTRASEEVSVIVFSDVDMLDDRLMYMETVVGMRAIGDNEMVVFNALDFLSGDHNLMSTRARGRLSRPFDVVDDLEARIEKEIGHETKQVEEDIKKFEEDLRELSRGGVTEENVHLVEKKAMANYRELREKLRAAERRKRQLKLKRRDAVEALKFRLQVHNLLWAPLGVLLIAVGLGIHRAARARYYTTRFAKRRSSR
jgi:ABC-type uncharacterized transport system involved in gliding motility auxiliary subunit